MSRIAILAATLLTAVAGWGMPATMARAADVPYVPTSQEVVDAMLGMAQIGPDDYLIDLGSGDGRIVIAAAKKYGARGFGVEIDGALVNEARLEARRQGVSERAEFGARNLFVTDIDRATVVTMYLLPSINLQLRPRLFRELKPGTRVVSHDFDMGDWQPDDRTTVAVPDKPYGDPRSDIFLWVIPVNAAGRWQWRLAVDGALHEYDLAIAQRFQVLAAAGQGSGRRVRFEGGRVRGERVTFTLTDEAGSRQVRQEYSGRISGDEISGTVTLAGAKSGRMEWSAKRSARGRIDGIAGLPLSERRILIAEERE